MPANVLCMTILKSGSVEPLSEPLSLSPCLHSNCYLSQTQGINSGRWAVVSNVRTLIIVLFK